MKNIFSVCCICILSVILFSCDKNGSAKPAGGLLPTNYIMVKDSTFTPQMLTVVSGSSITFVNNTAAAHTIRTNDSTTIRDTTIAPGKSFFFKKDTSGTFSYHCKTHPVATGAFILTP